MSSESRPRLSIESASVEGVAVVRLRGCLSWSSVRGLIEAVEADRSEHGIVLDLRDVEFMDSAGTGLVVRIVTDAAARRMPLAIAAREPIAEVLRHVGLFDVVPCCGSVADALAALRREGAEPAHGAR